MDIIFMKNTGDVDKDYKDFFSELKREFIKHTKEVLDTSMPFTKISNETEISRSHLSKFFKGEIRILPVKLNAIADLIKFDVTLKQFLFRINTAIELKRGGLDEGVLDLIGIKLPSYEASDKATLRILASGYRISDILRYVIARQLSHLKGDLDKISVFTGLSIDMLKGMDDLFEDIGIFHHQEDTTYDFKSNLQKHNTDIEKFILNGKFETNENIFVKTSEERISWFKRNQGYMHKTYFDILYDSDGNRILNIKSLSKLIGDDGDNTS